MLLMSLPVLSQAYCAALYKTLAIFFNCQERANSASSQFLVCLLESHIFGFLRHRHITYLLPTPETKECP